MVSKSRDQFWAEDALIYILPDGQHGWLISEQYQEHTFA
jgi:hypothetical protein